MKKISLLIICLVMLFSVCGCNNANSNTDETNNNQQTQEKTQEEKNEEYYLQAKKYYENKEYAYAYNYFSYIKDYKDVKDILNNDKYFKLSGNKYTGTTTSYSITFDFTRSTDLQLTYVTKVGGDSIYGAYKIVDSRIYLETSYHSYQYNETDWYITNVNDNNIAVKFKGTTYTLNKE